MELLNLINYQLFILSNTKYLKFIDKITSKSKVLYLDKFENYNYTNEIFRIDELGKVIFYHHQNLIQFLDITHKSMININIKNLQSYTLIKTIIALQKDFLISNNIQDLKYFSHKDILSYHKECYDIKLVASNISTISHNTFYKDKLNNIYKLNYLVPKRHYILYIKIRYILNHHIDFTDKQLCNILDKKFNINIPSKVVYKIRKQYFIPNKKYRKLSIYKIYERNYDIQCHLNYENIKQRYLCVVYELLSLKLHQYSFDTSFTVYIGSTNNLYKRLASYISGYAHSKKLRYFLLNEMVYFRFIEAINYKDLEKDILEAFYNSFGEYPLLNCNRVL